MKKIFLASIILAAFVGKALARQQPVVPLEAPVNKILSESKSVILIDDKKRKNDVLIKYKKPGVVVPDEYSSSFLKYTLAFKKVKGEANVEYSIVDGRDKNIQDFNRRMSYLMKLENSKTYNLNPKGQLEQIQDLSNLATHHVTEYKNNLEKMLQQSSRIVELTERAAFNSIRDAIEKENQILSSQSLLRSSVKDAHKDLEHALKVAKDALVDIKKNPAATKDEKDKAQKLVASLESTLSSVSASEKLNDEVIPDIKDTLTMSEAAKKQAEPFIKTAESARKAHLKLEKAVQKARAAANSSVKPFYDLSKLEEMHKGFVDCANRNQSDCSKRDNYCQWLSGAGTCSFKCAAVKSKEICSAVGHGLMCSWETKNNVAICERRP